MSAFAQWRGPVFAALACLAWAAPVFVATSAAQVAPPPAPTHRELWVPERSLAAALKTMPKAVLLTREQFQSLLRESAPPAAADAGTPPASAVLRSARYTGSLGDRAALMSAEFVVDGLGDAWTELPLTLDPRWLGAVTVDGTTAVAATDQAAVLVVRGAGRHVVRIDFAAPVTASAGSRTLALRAPGAVEATLVLTVPETTTLQSALPFQRDRETATFALPPSRDEVQIHWMARDIPPLESSALFQDCRFVYFIDAAQVRGDLSLVFHGALKNLPGSVALPIPAESQILDVDGTELARWSLAGDQLLAEFQPGERRRADLRVVLSHPVDDAATTLHLPAPLAAGMHRASGTFTLLSHDGLRVRRVTAGALAVRDDTQAPPAFAERPDFRGTWAFPVLLAAPEVEIERLNSRFTATLDTQITLDREAVRLTRHLTFQPRDGTLFSPQVTGLLAGEEIESVTLAGGGEMAWRPTDAGLTLATPAGTAPGQTLNIVVTSTLRPPGWSQLSAQPVTFAVTSAHVPGAEKVSGYVAVDFDPSMRVTTPRTDGLEPRDPRQFAGKLPLSGRLAWFRLDAFQLDLAVARRAVEFDASIAIDVLPLLNSLEVEGQITLDVAHGGLRELTVGFPASMAPSVRWQSPLVAEKSMADDGRWTLKFHQETTGTPHLRFHASLPLSDSSTASGTERRFAAQVPFPTIAAARRSAGTLVVEANSDTELAFVPQALDDLDTRDAPAIDGYAPRHRLVAGYAWRGGQPALAIDGVRHRAGDLAGTVVDSLALDSVISADGPHRHQAALAIRSAGAQFLDLTLPARARVLSVVIDGMAAKPIRGPDGTLRLPLPGTKAELRIIYETAAAPMSTHRHTTLPPIVLDPKIPVLDTRWRLHLPEGFSYSAFETNLTEKDAPPPPPTLARAVMDAPLIAALTAKRHSGVVLMEVERSSSMTAGDLYDPVAGGKAMMRSMTFLPAEMNIITSSESLSRVVTRLNLVDRWKNDVGTIDEAVAKLARMVKVNKEAGTDLLRLEVRSPDKAEAAELANAVAEAYIEHRKGIENERIHLGFQTLSHTRKSQEQEVERARTKMLELVQELGIVDLSAASPSRLDFKAQLDSIKDKDGEALIDAAATMNLLDPKSTAIYNQHIQDKRAAAQLVSSGLDESHPEIVAIRAGMAVQREQLNSVVSQLKPSLIDKQNIEKLTSEQKDESILDPGKYAQYQEAKDQYSIAQEILNKMIDEQERARVVALMPRKPATIHEFATAGGAPVASATVSFAPLTESPLPTPPTREHAGVRTPISTDQVMFADAGGLGGGGPGGQAATRAGLLPLAFALPEGGRTVIFLGSYAPAPLSFRAEAWDRQVRRAWLWMLAGGLSFGLLNVCCRRPLFIGMLGALTLHFAPELAARADWTPIANALLTGWLVALGIALVMAVAHRATDQKARTGEVAHV